MNKKQLPSDGGREQVILSLKQEGIEFRSRGLILPIGIDLRLKDGRHDGLGVLFKGVTVPEKGGEGLLKNESPLEKSIRKATACSTFSKEGKKGVKKVGLLRYLKKREGSSEVGHQNEMCLHSLQE